MAVMPHKTVCESLSKNNSINLKFHSYNLHKRQFNKGKIINNINNIFIQYTKKD